MDAVIAGILIVVVTGVLVAIVRAYAQKPRPPVRRADASDILGLDILGHQVHDASSDASGIAAHGDFLDL